jgi:3-oxoacyl-[acyl-carrier-protein] synthase II
MLSSERRVVITGLGIVSPIGVEADAFWSALEQRRGAVKPIQSFQVEGLPSGVGAEVLGFDLKKSVHIKDKTSFRKNLKYMARDIQLAVGAAQLAMADAGFQAGDLDPTRLGIDLGAGLISSELDELAPAISHASAAEGVFDYRVWGREGIPAIPPYWLLKYLPNMLACHISIMMDCQGPSNTITEADAASVLALGEASRIIARGKADVMISGGADSKIHPLSFVRMTLLNQLSHWDGDPSQACKPFDRRRDGWVPGEGSAVFILEEREHALKRGARILGEILGFGSGCDAYPAGGQDPEGLGTELAIRAALRDAAIDPAELGHLNAHGAGSPVSDLAEARAIHRVFNGSRPPVTALKGYFGNIVSGGGAVELAGSLLGVNRGAIPPVLNCDDPDPRCDLDLVLGAPRPTSNPVFLKTNLTRNGQAAAIIVRGEPSLT